MDDKLYTPMGESPPNRLKTAKKQNIMPSIAQQDYIVINWEGMNQTDAAKKAEVDSILKNLFNANPFSLFSVIFVDYAGFTARILSYYVADRTVIMGFVDLDSAAFEPYEFDLI